MKKLFILPLLLIALSSSAQISKVKSYLGDSIWMYRGSRQLTPIVVTINGDTARSVLWYVGPISRDSTASTVLNITLYDRNASPIASRNLGISESAYNRWSGLFTAIDNYIHNQIGRITLH